MKRRSFLQLLAAAFGASILGIHRVPAEAEAATPALTQAHLDEIQRRMRAQDLCDRATQFGREEAGQISAEIAQRMQNPNPFLPGPWPDTYIFYGPEVRNMVVPKKTLPVVIEDRAPWK